eukprot:COSAG01_NODE_50017_length_367_cov_0.768657_1_plen_46_part_01
MADTLLACLLSAGACVLLVCGLVRGADRVVDSIVRSTEKESLPGRS